MAKNKKRENTQDPESNLANQSVETPDQAIVPESSIPENVPETVPEEQVNTNEPIVKSIKELKGKFLKLSSRELFWKLPSGRICLDGFGQNSICEVPEKLTEDEFEIIKSGLELGKIDLFDKKPTSEAPVNNVKLLNSDDHIYARRLLDERNLEILSDSISKTFSLVFLKACHDIETFENKRPQVIEMLNTKLSSIRG